MGKMMQWMFAVLLLLTAQQAWAQSYITDVMVVGADDDDDAEDMYDDYRKYGGWEGIWQGDVPVLLP